MSVKHLLRTLGHEQVTLWGLLFDGLFLVDEIGRGLSLGFELCKSRSLDLHSLYIRSFSIIDDL